MPGLHLISEKGNIWSQNAKILNNATICKLTWFGRVAVRMGLLSFFRLGRFMWESKTGTIYLMFYVKICMTCPRSSSRLILGGDPQWTLSIRAVLLVRLMLRGKLGEFPSCQEGLASQVACLFHSFNHACVQVIYVTLCYFTNIALLRYFVL